MEKETLLLFIIIRLNLCGYETVYVLLTSVTTDGGARESVHGCISRSEKEVYILALIHTTICRAWLEGSIYTTFNLNHDSISAHPKDYIILFVIIVKLFVN